MAGFGQFFTPRYQAPRLGGYTPLQQDYFREEPQAVFGAYLAGLPTRGPGAVSGSFREYAERWLNDQYRGYQGAVASRPDLQLTDYLNERDPYRDYLDTNPYARAYRLARPTRLVRR